MEDSFSTRKLLSVAELKALNAKSDIAGFLRVEGLPVSDEITRACDEYRFEGPIFRAPPWRAIYTPDDERIQDWEEAIASDRAVCAAWRDHGYALIDLPMVSAEERASFVLARL